jgi:hypothetical protein
MALINASGSNNKEIFVQALLSALSDFYNKNPGTNLSKLYEALADVLALTDRDISALLNDNFLSVSVTDEIVERTTTILDVLRREGVFKVDRVGFSPTNFARKELHRIEAKNTVITLQYVPVDFTSVQIYNANDPNKVAVSFITDFSAENNTITVAGVDKPGLYFFEYVETGNIKSESETMQVPTELFDIGFGEGGFGNFGFGE